MVRFFYATQPASTGNVTGLREAPVIVRGKMNFINLLIRILHTICVISSLFIIFGFPRYDVLCFYTCISNPNTF